MVKPIRVLVIDDSALVREILCRLLSRDTDIEIIGTAVDPLHAIKKIKEQRPDVLTLDMEMPRMDGLTFLERLMSVYPMPVVVISSLTQLGSATAIRALELGAVDVVAKPVAGLNSGLEELFPEIVVKIKNAAAVNMDTLRSQARRERLQRRPGAEQLHVENKGKRPMVSSTDKIIAIGASTGGTVAVKQILKDLPANLPGILIVLHMPAGFTASYAQSLNGTCRMKVKEASDGELLAGGCTYIAPGGRHMLLEKNTGGYRLRLDNGPPVNRHRPSVDKTFLSVAGSASPNSLGVILTGMGDDGARGMKEMHDRGSLTIAQDEQSSVVFGMPKKAIALGAVDKVLPLNEIANNILSFVGV